MDMDPFVGDRENKAFSKTSTAIVMRFLSSSAVVLLLFAIIPGNCQPDRAIRNYSKPNKSLESQGGNPIDAATYQHSGGLNRNATISSSMLKIYNRVNDMRAYHLDLHSYRDEAKYWGDPSHVDSNKSEHRERCFRHLNIYDNLLRSFKDSDPVNDSISWDSMKLSDSFGQRDAGLFDGHQFWLGSYESCLKFTHRAQFHSSDQQEAQPEIIKAHYCIGIGQFSNWKPEATKTSLKIGLCLPETCTTTILNESRDNLKLVEKMMLYNIGQSGPFNKLKLKEVFCLPHETSRLRQFSASGLGFFYVVGSMIALCCLATIADHLEFTIDKKFGWLPILIDSFSITRNTRKFFTIRDDPKPRVESSNEAATQDGNLNVCAELEDRDQFDRSTFFNIITGIKCIGLIWIIAAHTLLVSPTLSRNCNQFDALTETYVVNILTAAHLMVDTFFALSGLIAAYLIFKEGIGKMSPTNWAILIAHRYWRLTPIYLLCFWFSKSVGGLAASGPMWDYGTSELSPRLMCARESWWQAILHLSDFKSPKQHCVPFAWFIANNLKFCFLMPFFLTQISKSTRRGYSLILATVVANVALVYWLASKTEIDIKYLADLKPEIGESVLNNMDEVYVRPYSRIGTFVIGLVAGHLIYLSENRQLKFKMSDNFKLICWTLFTVLLANLTFLFKLAKYLSFDEKTMKEIFQFTTSLIRPIWAVCTCWLIYALSHGQAKWLSNIFSARIWRTMVKVSFCGYLVQGEIIANLYLSLPVSETFFYMDVISRALIVTCLTILISFPIVIFIESPLIGIERLILPSRKQKNTVEKPSIQQIQLQQKCELSKEA